MVVDHASSLLRGMFKDPSLMDCALAGAGGVPLQAHRSSARSLTYSAFFLFKIKSLMYFYLLKKYQHHQECPVILLSIPGLSVLWQTSRVLCSGPAHCTEPHTQVGHKRTVHNWTVHNWTVHNLTVQLKTVQT